jgi:REP element-mobilizing transposase RayT
MNRAIDHGIAFRDDNDRVEFGQRLADVYEHVGVTTHAYCLMTTHYHLLLHCPDGGLSEAMQRLGSIYTRHVNDRAGRDGAIFRGRFSSRAITDDRYLLTACRYIHRNALDLPGVDDVTSYRWSSHRTYLGLRATPPWMRTDAVLAHWDGDVEAFDAFVRAGDTSDLIGVVDAHRLRAMCNALAITLDERHERSGRLARLLIVGWAADFGVAAGTIMEAFGISTRGALHSAVHRARQRVAREPSLDIAVRRAIGLTSTQARSRLGSDPWRDQRAARAAS